MSQFSARRPIPSIPEALKFNGSARPGDVVLLMGMEREFQQHLIHKLFNAHAVPRPPDAVARMAAYFNTTKCYFIPDDDVEEEEELPLLYDSGAPRPITDELVMETFGLHLDPANPNAVLPDDPVGFIMPEPRFLFGPTAEGRRAARSDYDKDQKIITVAFDEYKGQSLTGFAIMDAYSNKTGQNVYKDFLPGPDKPCGDVFGAVTAVKTVMTGSWVSRWPTTIPSLASAISSPIWRPP